MNRFYIFDLFPPLFPVGPTSQTPKAWRVMRHGVDQQLCNVITVLAMCIADYPANCPPGTSDIAYTAAFDVTKEIKCFLETPDNPDGFMEVFGPPCLQILERWLTPQRMPQARKSQTPRLAVFRPVCGRRGFPFLLRGLTPIR